MDVALLREVESERALAIVARRFQIRHDVSEEWKRREYADFLPEQVAIDWAHQSNVIGVHNMTGREMNRKHILLVWVNTILLRRN